MDKAKLEKRKQELEDRFEVVKNELKEASQKVSALQTEIVELQGAYKEVSKLLEEGEKK